MICLQQLGDVLAHRNYKFPHGTEGVGSDIKWCGRHTGGKFCMLCKRKAPFEVWSKEWHWYYLHHWYEDTNKAFWNYTHISWRWLYRRFKIPRYRTRGLKDNDFKALVRKGCKRNKKCKCINLIQTGSWYCPTCYTYINAIAKHNGLEKHDVMIMNRLEVKEEALILLLSGAL
jgi:hypothetical protein